MGDLTDAYLGETLKNTRFDEAIRVNAYLGDADLTSASFVGAIIRGAKFIDVGTSTLSKAAAVLDRQLPAERSARISLRREMTGWDLERAGSLRRLLGWIDVSRRQLEWCDS